MRPVDSERARAQALRRAEAAHRAQQTEASQLAFIQNPNEWPRFPVLPLKRRRDEHPGWPQLGVMVCAERWATTVFLCSIYDWTPSAPKIDYPSYEAIIADGWRVD